MNDHHGQLHHIELYVSHLQSSVVFWSWLLRRLGYQPYQQWESGESWKLGATYVVLVQVAEGFREPLFDRRRVGLNHVAFHARSREEVKQLAEEAQRRGLRLLYSDRYPSDDYYAIYIEDPDGIKVEVVAE